MFIKAKDRLPCGISITSDQLILAKFDQKRQIHTFHANLPNDVCLNNNVNPVIDLLQNIYHENPNLSRYIGFALAKEKIVTKIISINSKLAQDLETHVWLSIENEFAVSINEVYLDYQCIASNQLFIVITKKENLIPYFTIAKQCKLKLVAINLSNFAKMRACEFIAKNSFTCAGLLEFTQAQMHFNVFREGIEIYNSVIDYSADKLNQCFKGLIQEMEKTEILGVDSLQAIYVISNSKAAIDIKELKQFTALNLIDLNTYTHDVLQTPYVSSEMVEAVGVAITRRVM